METSRRGELGRGVRPTQQAWGLHTCHPPVKLDGRVHTGSLHTTHAKMRRDGVQLGL